MRAIFHHILPARYRNAFKVARAHLDQERRNELISKRNQQLMDHLLCSQVPIRLELGAGERKMNGWTSIDISDAGDINLDLSQPIPLPDNVVTTIYSSHMLEHFSYPHPMMNLLTECYRILKPGGGFSVAVPNARLYVNSYFYPERFDPEFYCRYKPAYCYNSKIDYINYIAYMAGEHRYMFDEENLIAILSQVGFRDGRLRDFDPLVDLEARRYQTIYAQGTK